MPAGEISFSANIDRSARLDVSEYPEMMGVTGRYAGKGLVAQPGFTEPRYCFPSWAWFTGSISNIRHLAGQLCSGSYAH